ncbi:hypothetical protein FHX82_001441 [Amycolatopsis bartoniae]|uniref:Four-helix bundle copper-binding protein n=1 Tax=Amycolatopsis bartoniae TaxID=941986 RepID=A0A8H9IT13_9PSEU|nr:four-helix bundle copper-binding protein [Amycolatopsis bartoniae]MBB2934421.1 hypothetical protein [Amycolatopsis bartoniae]TVT02951.1 four-helix bundle copper-binding protein [Amycolatopsis bartoniae]GHF47482.1 hypothetical protein GCM10017566_20860 [Amycolatopsis bartoniae]
MTKALAMLESHPADLGGVDPEAIAAAIQECLTCAQACTACADACLAESDPAAMRDCIRTDLDCADVCEVTVRILSRRGDALGVTRQLLAVCEQACRACAEECERHAEHHRHCAECAEACRSCEDACQQLRQHLG